MAISTVPIYAGVVPNRKAQSPVDFTNAAVTWTDYQAVTLVPGINNTVSQIDFAIDRIAQDVISAAASADASANSASESAESAIIAQNASKLLGEWSVLAGGVNIGETVINNGGKWQATTNIADVTASEPAISNNDWLLINASDKVVPIADTETLNANVINQISATQSNPLPLANSVPANTRLLITVPETYKGIATTHLVSGSDTTTDSKGVNNGFIINWPSGGTLFVTSNGLNNWSY